MRWVIEEILSIVNGLDLAAIHEDLSFRQRKAISRKVRAEDEEEHRLFERDPFIYFYEDFLAQIRRKMKKIARRLLHAAADRELHRPRGDDILKDTFGDHGRPRRPQARHCARLRLRHRHVSARGFQQIFENIGGADSGKRDLIVRDHMLKNIFGFEYLIAPYTIAHLKLSQYLAGPGPPAELRTSVFRCF